MAPELSKVAWLPTIILAPDKFVWFKMWTLSINEGGYRGNVALQAYSNVLEGFLFTLKFILSEVRIMKDSDISDISDIQGIIKNNDSHQCWHF